VELKAGDQFVLRGVHHAWTNPWRESCVMSVVLVRSN
jgi:hypothetical protein